MATFAVTIADDPGTQSDGTTGAGGKLSWALAQANAQAGPHTIGAEFIKVCLSLWRKCFDRYRPELHYMRGPGPRWREKYGRA
jgi:hypothetical protein